MESEDTSLLLADIQKVNDKGFFSSERVIYIFVGHKIVSRAWQTAALKPYIASD